MFGQTREYITREILDKQTRKTYDTFKKLGFLEDEELKKRFRLSVGTMIDMHINQSISTFHLKADKYFDYINDVYNKYEKEFGIEDIKISKLFTVLNSTHQFVSILAAYKSLVEKTEEGKREALENLFHSFEDHVNDVERYFKNEGITLTMLEDEEIKKICIEKAYSIAITFVIENIESYKEYYFKKGMTEENQNEFIADKIIKTVKKIIRLDKVDSKMKQLIHLVVYEQLTKEEGRIQWQIIDTKNKEIEAQKMEEIIENFRKEAFDLGIAIPAEKQRDIAWLRSEILKAKENKPKPS